MKRILLLLMLVLPFAANGQDRDGGLSFQQPPSAAQQPPRTAPTPTSGQPQRPRSEGSMVGYIDDAIVGSELRIRFDAGFHTDFPDRAEFFYAKCGCYRKLVGTGNPATDATAPGPPSGVATDLNFQQLYVFGEYAPNKSISFFAELPVRWLQPKAFVPTTGSFSNQSGLGDIRTGVKLGLISSSEDGRYLTFQFRIDTPSGDGSKGLGTNHVSIEPALLFKLPVTSRFEVESEFAFWHPIGGSPGVATATDPNPGSFAGNVLFYGVGPSYQLYSSNRVRFGPVIELAGWHVLGGYQTVWVAANRIGDKVGGTNIVNLKMGARTSIGVHNSFYVGYGRALTDAIWYQDIVRAEYRYSF